MTTTPAPTDHDTLKAAVEAVEHLTSMMATNSRDWGAARDDAWFYGIAVGWGTDPEAGDLPDPDDPEGVGALPELAERFGWTQDAVARLRALHRAYASVPALLDELATERRQGAAMASITGEAIRQIAEERDAAREELAKVRAELERARAVALSNKRAHQTAFEECERLTAELDAMTGVAKALRITVAEMLSGKQHTRARTLTWESTLKYATEALANPATTAEPADELPGMWEQADLTGGQTDAEPAAG